VLFYRTMLSRCLPGVFLLALLLIPGPGECLAEDGILQLTRADFLLSDASSPPPDDAPWRPQTLPDNWNLSRYGAGGNSWYRLRFDLPHLPSQTQAVYIPRLSMNGAVYVNGQLVGSGGGFEEPVARNWNRPQFFLVPPNLLRPGENTVHLRLYVFPHTQGGVSVLQLGPEQALRPIYESRFFQRVILAQTLSLLIASIGVFMLVLYLRRREESMYGYFGLACLVWAVNTTNLYVQNIPVSTFHWEVLGNGSVQVYTVFLGFFVLRYARRSWGSFEWILWGVLIGAPVSLWMGGTDRFFMVSSFWHTLTLALMGGVWWTLFSFARRHHRGDAALLAFVGVVDLFLGVHDWMVHTNRLSYEHLHLMQFGAPLLFFVIGWMLIDRFVGTLREVERLNRELEERVTVKHAELERSFSRLQGMEREQAALEERQRIMREIHDGMGSQLTASVILLEEGKLTPMEVTAVLRECMDELRLVVDSLEPNENDLLTVLGGLRYRLEGRLKKCGISLDWQVSDLPPVKMLTPQTVLHILRILQEIFTNILKHARADTIRVETGVADPPTHAFIRISDNGNGIRSERASRGLSNMRHRAQTIGGALDISSASTGTSVTLRVPLSPPEL